MTHASAHTFVEMGHLMLAAVDDDAIIPFTYMCIYYLGYMGLSEIAVTFYSLLIFGTSYFWNECVYK